MAKKNQVFIDIVIDDKGTTKRVAVDAKKLGMELDKSARATEKGAKSTDKLSKSTKDLDRNMRGTAKMSSNTTKEFSKMSQGMGGLVGAYATLAAQVFAVSAAFQFLQSASDLRNLVAGQEALAAMTGTTYKTITHSIVEATDAQLKYADAAKAAAIGTASGLTASQLEGLASVAKNASFALGRDLTDSFNRLVRGVTKAEPELLDELGIILRLEPATKKYAESIGKAASELNAFERTQAVTNEVLEQGINKFEKIEAMMSRDAAVLAQFTKSFDSLVNTVKMGLIETLTPGLKFLSENTLALVSALALFALPITKAILPNMDAWIDRNNKLMKAEERAQNKRDKQVRKEKKNLKILMTSHKELVKQRQADAESLLSSRGVTGAGAAALGAGDTTPRGTSAAQKMIDAARTQIDQKRDRTGKLKEFNQRELDILQESLNEQGRMHETQAQKRARIADLEVSDTEKRQRKRSEAWGKANRQILKGGKVLAVGMNLAFNAIAIFGILSLLYEGAVALYRMLNPLSKLQEAEAKSAEALTEKYKVLNEELARNAQARKTILAGGDTVQAVGQSLQGVDVPNLMKELNQMGARTDKTSGAYKDARKEIMGTLLALSRMDRRFIKIYSEFKEFGHISDNTARELTVLSNSFIDMGQNLASLPQLMKDTNTAFSDLGKDASKSTSLSKAVDKSGTEMKALNKGILDSEKQLTKDMNEQKAQQTKNLELWTAKQMLQTNYALSNKKDPVTGKPIAQAQEQVDLERARKRLQNRIGLLEGQGMSGDFESDEARTRVIEAANRELDLLKERLGIVEKEHTILAQEENRRIKRVKQQLISQAIFARNRAHEITLAGKLHNIEEERFKEAVKLEEAEHKVIDARERLRQAEGRDNEQDAKENLELAEDRFRVAQQEHSFKKEAINMSERELQFQREQLKLVQERVRLERTLFSDKKALDYLKGISGGSDASLKAIRAAERELLQSQINAAAQATKITNAKEQEELEKKLKARRQMFLNEAIFLSESELDYLLAPDTDAYKEIQASVAASSGIQAEANRKTEASLKNQLRIRDDIGKKILDQGQASLDDATARVGTGGFQGSARAAFEAENSVRNLDLSKKEKQALVDKAILTHELLEVEERRAALAESIQSSMSDAFMSLIDGTKSAKQAFGDMAKSILASLAQMIVKMLVLKMLQTAMPSLFGAPAAPTSAASTKAWPFRYGGVAKDPKNYSQGGIARGRDSGYGAVLHGTEAVVPLPDNRSIPVTLNGAGGQNNNVTVNVAMDSSGNVSQNSQQDGAQAGKLGSMIAAAVQQELQFQKRSGGILNPYGVS